MVKKVIGLALIVVVAGGALWWFFLRNDPPAELSVDSGSDSSASSSAPTPDSLDGTWTVEQGDSTAGFRIEESFAGGLADHTAVGRSTAVTGSITIAGTEITEGNFTVDLTELAFTDDPGIPVANRVNAMRDRGLETTTFPEATLVLTAPIDFGATPPAGETATATATGDLTIHGVTNTVTFDVEAKVDGNTIRVATADPVPVVLADYDIEKPTGGPIAEVSDEGSFEFLVVFAPS